VVGDKISDDVIWIKCFRIMSSDGGEPSASIM